MEQLCPYILLARSPNIPHGFFVPGHGALRRTHHDALLCTWVENSGTAYGYYRVPAHGTINMSLRRSMQKNAKQFSVMASVYRRGFEVRFFSAPYNGQLLAIHVLALDHKHVGFHGIFINL